MEELVQQRRRAECYATVKIMLNVVFVETWLTGFIASITGLHGKTPERAFNLITHPWDLWTDPHAFPVLLTGSLVIITTLAAMIGGVLGTLLGGPRFDPAAIRRRYLGDH